MMDVVGFVHTIEDGKVYQAKVTIDYSYGMLSLNDGVRQLAVDWADIQSLINEKENENVH